MNLIKYANAFGTRLWKVCYVLGVSVRNYEWFWSYGGVKDDKRPYAEMLVPMDKLSDKEYQSVVNIVTIYKFADIPPSQIVPTFANRWIYISSESMMNKILKNERC